MKCLFFLGILAVARAGLIPAAAPALLSTGTSIQSRTQDALGNYAFGYDEAGATGGTSRRESGSPAGVVGSYTLRAADGRARVVNYVADAAGFRANIQTNEPGVDPSRDPAATLINKAGIIAPAAPLALAAAPAIAAPLPAPAPIAAPLPLAAAPAIAAPLPAPAPIAAPLPLAAGPLPIPAALPALAAPAAPLLAAAPASSIAIASQGALTTVSKTGALAAPAAPAPWAAPGLLAAKLL